LNPPLPIYRASQVLAGAGAPLGSIVRLATGVQANATCAIKSDHTLWCWGDLSWLADAGTTLTGPYAQQIKGSDGQAPLSGVIQASISYDNGCALISGSPNSVYCWGYDAYKQLGQGDTTNRQYPIKIPGLTSPTKVVVSYGNYGNENTVCVLDSAQVLCLGSNFYGAAGDSAGNPVPSATAVVTNTNAVLSGITDVEDANYGFGATKNDGTLWLWGNPNGNNAYASSNGTANVVALGWASDARYATTGGYFNGKTTVNVSCGPLSQ
jgi:alpha-tubulin suppressor-like RCC1 family protein